MTGRRQLEFCFVTFFWVGGGDNETFWTYHHFVQDGPRALTHLIKLVDTTHAVIAQNQSTAESAQVVMCVVTQ